MATKKRGPRSAADRVAKLLVIIPWLVKRKRVKLADVAREFDMQVEDLVEDIMLASLCGIPPYSPDSLIDVFVDEDMVVAEVPSFLDRPLRLNTAELFALVTMSSAALAVADDRGPLASALGKLQPLMPSEAATIAIEVATVPHLDELRRAVERHEAVEIDYFAPSSGMRTTRTIAPRRVFDRQGHWYVSADDDRSGEQREFRIDRIEGLRNTGRVVESRRDATVDETESNEWFVDAADRVTLRVAPEARWLVEPYPAISREVLDDGGLEVTLGVSSTHWLGRLLVRGGTAIEVVDGAVANGLRKQTAGQILARYR
jgi:proteasome accessory factor C